MSYYVLPKINSQNLINILDESQNIMKPYISQSLSYYIDTIKNQIENIIMNSDDLSCNSCNEFSKIINPCEYIFSKVPGSKYSVSKLKPISNLFYDILEVSNVLSIFDIYENVSINSLHISDSVSDTIECFEILRENYEDQITSFNSFTDETICEINKLTERFNFLVFESSFDNLNSYFIFLARCLMTVFKCQAKNGTCIIKIDNTLYKPIIDFIYIMSSLYDKVYIIKPNSSNITTSEKYLICKNYQSSLCKNDLSEINYYTLRLFNSSINRNINTIKSFLNFDIPQYFLSKLDDINIITGHQQVESLNIVLNLLKNKNREDRSEVFRKTNIVKSISWCEKYKIPYNKFSEKVNIFLPLANKDDNENKNEEENNENDENDENNEIVLIYEE
jgi:hypothetical protein